MRLISQLAGQVRRAERLQGKTLCLSSIPPSVACQAK